MEKEKKSTGKTVPTKVEGYTSDFGSRISAAIDRIGTLAEAGRVAGVTDEQIGRWRDGLSKPNLFGITRLAKAARVDVSWLATGEGLMENDASSALVPAALPLSIRDDFALVPRLDIRASAGSGNLAVDEEVIDFLAFQASWLRARNVNPDKARVMTAKGDSMEPTIRDGDVLLVDTSIDRIRDNALYIIVFEGLVFVKRIHVKMNGAVLLISDNDRYPPEEITSSAAPRLHVAGRVVWFGRSI
ncbi:XRE family transcriptional regulator [Neorhizobium petrolearium]|uniref:XRE family transcriptional regulator n=1 Tax=Neorhizobium petrolearium TaxID=515361 RepID=UPI003F80A0E3